VKVMRIVVEGGWPVGMKRNSDCLRVAFSV
jgi:hypothetical protein